MKKKMKLFYMGAVVIAAGAVFFCGCGGSRNADAEQVAGADEKNKEDKENEVEQTNDSLRLSISDTEEEAFGPAIDAFREAYPDVDLQIETYSETSDVLARTEKMSAEIMAGEGPDLLFLSCYGTNDVEKLMKAGAFAPLDGLLAADSSWNAEDYVAAVLDAGKFDGGQYVMPLTYDAMVAVASEEGLKGMGFTKEDFTDTLSFLKNAAAMAGEPHENRILATVGQLQAFPDMLTGGFLDYKDGTVNVDADTLKEACGAYASLYEDDNVDDGSGSSYLYFEYGRDIAQGKSYLYVGLNMYAAYSAAGTLAAEATPVLIPLRDSEGRILSRVMRYAGIRANSPNKENAYRLLCLIMGEETQERIMETWSYAPVHKATADKALDRALEDSRRDGMAVVEMGELPEELVSEYKGYVLNPDICFFPGSVSIVQFMDDMRPYYTGESDYDACCQKFEDYVKIYLSE